MKYKVSLLKRKIETHGQKLRKVMVVQSPLLCVRLL